VVDVVEVVPGVALLAVVEKTVSPEWALGEPGARVFARVALCFFASRLGLRLRQDAPDAVALLSVS
jgi:hypothetical protein